MILNSGEFYGVAPRTANLELVSRFFEKYPNYAEKAFLSVKGGSKADTLEVDSSPENLKRSVDTILEKLRGKKSLDLFECARVDPNVPIEETIKTLSGFVSDGKFDYIGMSECAATTLRRGNKVHRIAAVEIEVSPWSYTKETKDVISTAEELGICVLGYSPLGRGFLTGKISKVDDLHPMDFRRRMTRFKEENFDHNMAIVEGLKAVAEKKGITPAQLCIAWVSALGPHVIPLPGSSKEVRTKENLAGGEKDVSPEEMAEIEKILADNPVKGDRYFGLSDKEMHLWG